jgi:ADP-heptose:LPS heptosyltransferase
VREVLIIRFGALGDLVLSTVLLDAMRVTDSPVRVTFVTKERWGSLLESDPRIDELVLLPEGASVRDVSRRLHREYDLILDAHGNLRSRMLCLHVRARDLRRLRKDTVARWLYRHGAPRPRALQRRLIDRFLDLLELDGGDFRPRIHVESSAERIGIGVAIGATHEAKRWPLDRFTELIAQVASAGEAVTVIGGPGEERLIADAVGDSGAETWDPQRPLSDLAARVAGMRTVVGNDSGLLHLAEAVDTPVVGLFGPTVEAWGYFPWRSESRVLEHDLECRPCSKMGEKPCRLPEKICLTRTSVDAVRNAISEVVDGRR